MIIVLKPQQKQEVVDSFIHKLTEQYDVQVNTWVGTHSTVLGLIGDTTAIDAEYIEAQDFVESVKRVQEPYKKANRKFHPDDTVITFPGGNEQVILCERGIRTYETFTRNTLDISAVPVLKRLSHLPVIVDPSHASGLNWLIEPLALAAAAIGADGLIIEVHNDPSHALCDGAQSITPAQFDALSEKVTKVSQLVHNM